jgi:succinoglycan biosynthesis protein ExoU
VAVARACDDGSRRLVILTQGQNGGPAAARNRALRATQASWVCVLDADDYLLSGRIAKLAAQAGDADLVADGLIRTSEFSAPPPLDPSSRAGDPAPIDLEAFVLGNVNREGRPRQELGFVKPLMRTAFLRRHDLTYDETLRLGEDYEFYARALALGAKMVLLPAQGYVAVERANSLSGRHSVEDLRRLRDCDRALASIRPLSARERRALALRARSVDCKLQWRLLIDSVKARDPIAAFRTFTAPTVGLYLAARLAQQVQRRWLGGAGVNLQRPTAAPLHPPLAK